MNSDIKVAETVPKGKASGGALRIVFRLILLLELFVVLASDV